MERIQTGAYRGHERARRGTIRQSATIVKEKEKSKGRTTKKEHTKQGEAGNGISRGILDKFRRPEH